MTYKKHSENKRRALKFESLEDRRLLSAVPFDSGEFEELTAKYSALALPETADGLNIITLDLAEGDGLAELKEAVETAARTENSDLIAVRTSADHNTLTFTVPTDKLAVNIDSAISGSLTIVGLGDSPLILDAVQLTDILTVTGTNTCLSLGGMLFTGSASPAAALTDSPLGASVVLIDSGTVFLDTVTFAGSTDRAAAPKELLWFSSDAQVYAEGISFLLEETDDTPTADTPTADTMTVENRTTSSSAVSAGAEISIDQLGTLAENTEDTTITDTQKRWTGEVWLGGTQWAYLTGIEAADAEKAQTLINTAVLKTDDYVDADKEDPYSGGVDCNLCWAATTANMLDYSGWATRYAQSNYRTAADTIYSEYFRKYFANAGGTIQSGLLWFFTGEYDGHSIPKDPYRSIRGFYSLEELAEAYSYADCFRVTADTMQEMDRNLKDHYTAVGLSVGAYDANGNRTGGHAMSLYGYTYDTAYSVDELERYTGLIVADSNDMTDKLTTYEITYDEEAGRYHFPHPDVEYGGDTGYLEDLHFLNMPYDTHAPGELAPYVPTNYGWSDCLFIQSGSESTVAVDNLPEYSEVYVSFSFANYSFLPSGDISCTLTLEGGNLTEPEIKTFSYDSIDQGYFYHTTDKYMGTLAAGVYTLTLTIDSGNDVDEYNEANNTVVRTFTIGDGIKLAAPVFTIQSVDAHSVTLNVESVPKADEYLLEIATKADYSDAKFWSAEVGTNTLTDLQPGTTYYIRTCAQVLWPVLEYAYSEWQSFTTVVETPSLTYDETECTQLRTFLERTDANGVKNGTKLAPAYDADNASTWSGITWEEIDGVKHVKSIHWVPGVSLDLAGQLDLSDCAHLETLVLHDIGIDELELRGCSALQNVSLQGNDFNFVNLSAQNTLKELILVEEHLETVLLSEEVLGELQILIDPFDSWLYPENAGTLIEDAIFTPSVLPFTTSNTKGTRQITFESAVLPVPAFSVFPSGSDAVLVTFEEVDYPFPYILEYSENADFTNAQTLQLLYSQSKSITGLNANTTYYFRVKAKGSGVYFDSEWSETVSVTTEEVSPFAGYDETECLKLQSFLEQTDENGVKNGTKLNPNYDPNKVTTWGSLTWNSINGTRRVYLIHWSNKDLCGTLDLSGFTNITDFMFCGNDNVISVNLSGCTSLQIIDLHENADLEVLDVSGCTALWLLYCYDNAKLRELNITDCTALKTLRCIESSLESLDLSSCQTLEKLLCGDNALTSLDVSGCTALTKLSCYSNPITTLDISNCELLEKLEISDMPLLDKVLVSESAVGKLVIESNGSDFQNVLGGMIGSSSCTLPVLPMFITNNENEGWMTIVTLASGSDIEMPAYDRHDYLRLASFLTQTDENGVMNGTKLNSAFTIHDPSTWAGVTWENVDGIMRISEIDWQRPAYTPDDQKLIGFLDVSGCTHLTTLRLLRNAVTGLNISGCTSITVLNVAGTTLTSLDASNCTSLSSLHCNSSKVTTLNVSGCTALQNLQCDQCKLTSIDISGCTNITALNCQGNRLTTLDLSECVNLVDLICYQNSFTALDFSACRSLQSVYAYGNAFIELDFSNCTALQFLSIRKIPQLRKITVAPGAVNTLKILSDDGSIFKNADGEEIATKSSTVPSLPMTIISGNQVISVSCPTCPVPALTVSADGANSVSLTIGNSENASGYTLEYAVNANFTNAQTLSFTNAGTQTVTGLNANTTYFFRVKANGTENRADSAWSETESVTTEKITLSIPSLTAQAASSDSVTVTIGNVQNASGYTLEYSTNANFTNARTKTFTTSGRQAVTGLAANTMYYFRVKANGTGAYADSVWSETASAQTEKIALSTPSLTVSAAAPDSVTVTIENIKNAAGYTLEYAENSNFTNAQTLTFTVSGTQTVTGLNANTKYFFRLKVNGTGNYSDSAWSKTASTTTKRITLPAPVLTASANGANTVSLMIENVAHANSYTLEYAENENFTNARTLTFTASGIQTVTKLNTNTTYFFRAKANGVGDYFNSAWSETVKAQTENKAYLAPTNLRVLAVSGNSIALEWSASQTNTNVPQLAQKYTVQYSADGGRSWRSVNANGTNAVLSRMKPGEYLIRVLAVKDRNFEASTASDPVSVTVYAPLTTPKLAVPKDQCKDDTFAVQVTNYTGELTSDANSVTFRMNGNSQTFALENGCGTANFSTGETVKFQNGIFTVTNAKANTQYKLELMFANEKTGSAFAKVNVKTTKTTYLAPTNISAVSTGANTISVSWSEAHAKTDASRFAQKYTVQYSTDGGKSWRSANVNGTETTLSRMKPGEYQIRVLAAKDSNFEASLASGSVTVTVYAPLTTPKLTALKDQCKDDSFAVQVTNYAGELANAANSVTFRMNGNSQTFVLENGCGTANFSTGETVKFQNGIFTVTNAQSNTQYKLELMFANEKTGSAFAKVNVKTTKTTYLAPTNFRVTASTSNSISLDWSDSPAKTDVSKLAQKYTVQYSTNGGKTWRSVSVKTSDATLTRLKSGTYLIRVLAAKDSKFEASLPTEILEITL